MSDNSGFDTGRDAGIPKKTSLAKKIYASIIIVSVIILGITVVCASHERAEQQKTYDHVIELIKQEDYFSATIWLRGLQSEEELDSDKYPDLATLEEYCEGMADLRRQNYIAAAKHLEECLGKDWAHDDLRRPADILREIWPLMEEQAVEESRAAEEEERLREKELRETGVPYVGMEESEITNTSIGAYSKTFTNRDVEFEGVREYTIYRWYKDGVLIFTARCCNGWVIDVSDYRDDLDSSGGATTGPHGSSDNFDDDGPSVEGYHRAEDFYYDHYDDFFDFEDAEDYYDEHGGL